MDISYIKNMHKLNCGHVNRETNEIFQKLIEVYNEASFVIA